jgi:hypothetical protein
MTRWIIRTTVYAVLVVGLLPVTQVMAGDFHIGINIGTPPPPPPPVVVTTPPQLIVVPGTSVYYAPEVPHNVFFYAKRYYVFHNGTWFYASSHNGPWTFIVHERVPRPVLAVPVEYYRVPPGHAKHHGPPPWAGHGKHKHHHKHWGKADD